jgi:transcriptional regulator with XRE-family HTH domain
VKNQWADYVKTNSNGDLNSTIATKVGVDPATVGRWVKGTSDPNPRQVVAFARSYNVPAIAALIAADYLTPEDVDVVVPESPTLDGIATNALVDELARRLDAMGILAGWLRSLGSDDAPPGVEAAMSAEVLRYIDPAARPSTVDPQLYLNALGPRVDVVAEIDGAELYGVTEPADELSARRRKSVGGPTQDEEAAAETDVAHEEDTDDYTP